MFKYYYYMSEMMGQITATLAGLQVLHSSASVAELSWACGRVVHHVLGFR